MNIQIETVKNESDSKLITILRHCTKAEKNEILMTLYDRYKNLILKICFHYLKDYDLAQDAFHDAFIKVIENAEKLKNPAVFRSWFVTITRNLCIDRLRRMSNKDEESMPLNGTKGRIEDLYVASIEKDRVMHHLSGCIHNLDESLITILKLRWEGFKAAEISKMIGINPRQLRRSYRKIKMILESCMRDRGIKITMDQIIDLGTFGLY